MKYMYAYLVCPLCTVACDPKLLEISSTTGCGSESTSAQTVVPPHGAPETSGVINPMGVLAPHSVGPSRRSSLDYSPRWRTT